MVQAIRRATAADVELIHRFVEDAGLDSRGIEMNVDNFLLMEDNECGLLATIGIEVVDKKGLLRSFVLAPKAGMNQLIEFINVVLSFAKQQGIEQVCLCTDKEQTATVFELLGFNKLEKIPEEIRNTDHYQQIKAKQTPIVMGSNY